MIALIAWLGKAILDKHFTLSRSWLHLVVVFFGIGYLITSFFSEDRYLSFVGNSDICMGSLRSAVFIIFLIPSP